MNAYHKEQRADRARFLRDTAEHRMEIIHDDGGMFRHIRFARPDTNTYHYNLTTMPGRLVFSGDMGSFVVARTYDMFTFHRIDWDRTTPTIDYGYWASKCEAVDRHGGTEEFDEDIYMDVARRELRGYLQDGRFSFGERRNIVEDAREHLFGYPMDEREAVERAMSWECPVTRRRPFDDFWDHTPFTKPAFRWRWACWAIAEGIRSYDLGGTKAQRSDYFFSMVLKGEI